MITENECLQNCTLNSDKEILGCDAVEFGKQTPVFRKLKLRVFRPGQEIPFVAEHF